MEKIGATGNFPKGKIYPDDKGELRAALTTDKKNGLVRLDFGTSVSWLCLYKKDLRTFIDGLEKAYKELG